MPYGYQNWLKDEGEGKDPAVGAYEKVLEIIENLKYPQPGWGSIKLDDLRYKVEKMRGGPSSNAAWDEALRAAVELTNTLEFQNVPGGKVEPKPLVTELKKLIKGAGKSEAKAAPKEETPEESEDNASE